MIPYDQVLLFIAACMIVNPAPCSLPTGSYSWTVIEGNLLMLGEAAPSVHKLSPTAIKWWVEVRTYFLLRIGFLILRYASVIIVLDQW
ncbi:hypothetical protein BGZ63DRAFT_379022 [Mariannaea sp. PMI_226]|nr:hypothetical protein BGZ63DRAFT_379022 [Mariannaea sp. PMI_226]